MKYVIHIWKRVGKKGKKKKKKLIKEWEKELPNQRSAQKFAEAKLPDTKGAEGYTLFEEGKKLDI